MKIWYSTKHSGEAAIEPRLVCRTSSLESYRNMESDLKKDMGTEGMKEGETAGTKSGREAMHGGRIQARRRQAVRPSYWVKLSRSRTSFNEVLL